MFWWLIAFHVFLTNERISFVDFTRSLWLLCHRPARFREDFATMRCPRKSVVTANAQGEKMMHSCYVVAVRWDAEDVFVGEGNSLKQLPKISTFFQSFFWTRNLKGRKLLLTHLLTDSFVQVQLLRVMESSEMLGTCEKREESVGSFLDVDTTEDPPCKFGTSSKDGVFQKAPWHSGTALT